MSKTSVRKDIEKSVEEADDRDIFEKALDNPQIVIPAIVGGGALLGGRLGKKWSQRQLNREGVRGFYNRAPDIIIGTGAGGAAGTAAGMTATLPYIDAVSDRQQRRKRRKD